ncbi:MAG: hypothetical protein K1V99_08095 [Bacteroidales bacterium]|nr:hypothetical protein [Bacteroidales bacterium]
MNIAIKIYGNDRCCCRPDTTWERENRDYYVPDGIDSIHWSPIAFARISKAGKCIGEKFVSRYYDAVNFGALLYIGDILDGSAGSLACASCADHTSILPFPLYNPVVFGTEGNTFEINKNGERIFRMESASEEKGKSVLDMLEEAVCMTSRLTSLRTGDIVAVELGQVSPLAARADGDVSIAGEFCENWLFDFKIVF